MAENVTLGTVSSFTNDSSAVAIVNNNSQLIENAFLNVLDRFGTAPNGMGAVLDMNNFNIINLPAPATINSPVRLVDVISPGVSLTVPPVGTSGSKVPLLNGINTFGPATQSFIGNITTAIIADAAQVVVQNSSTTQEQVLTSSNTGGIVYDAVRATTNTPAGSTALNINAFGAYSKSVSGTGNAHGNTVSYYSLNTLNASNSCTWGANYRMVDSQDVSGHGFTGCELNGCEIDYLITSAATVISGFGLQVSSLPGWIGGGNGFLVANNTPANGRLSASFVSTDGAAPICLNVGAAFASGTSIPSQNLRFGWFDGGGVEHATNLFADGAGQLNWAGNVILPVPAATQIVIGMTQNSVNTWQLGTLANGHFFIFDGVAASTIMEVPTGGPISFSPRVAFAKGLNFPPINVQTGATYSVVDADYYIANNFAGTLTLTLPSAASYVGRVLVVRTYQNQTVVSASSNVSVNGGAASTAILAATAGKYAVLQSDSVNWIIIENN